MNNLLTLCASPVKIGSYFCTLSQILDISKQILVAMTQDVSQLDLSQKLHGFIMDMFFDQHP
jgi:hypothetical protein